MKRLMRPIWVVIALLFLLEAWLWDMLQPVVGRIVNVIPWGRIKPAIIRMIGHLSPQATLVVFIIPFAVLLPVKFLEIWLLTQRHWLMAIVVLILAKLVGLGVAAFIFDATQHKLLQMPWFKRLYDFVMWARGWAHDKVEPIKHALRAWLGAAVDRVMQQISRMLGPHHASRLLERLTRIRRRMRTTTPSP